MGTRRKKTSSVSPPVSATSLVSCPLRVAMAKGKLVHASRQWAAWGTNKLLVYGRGDKPEKKLTRRSDKQSKVVPKVLQEPETFQSSFFREKDFLGGTLAPLPGTERHPVLDIIKNRYENRFSPSYNDGFKLGLVVEGGGMRGITSAGMLIELFMRGFDTIFDGVYGSSAGAINSTYFLAQDPAGGDIYTNYIANSEFISLYRLLGRRKKPVLNISFLLDHVMENVVPLDWDKVVKSSTPLKVAASSIDQKKPVLLENFRDKQDLVECLRASATVPGIAGGPVDHRGYSLVDAMVYEPVPIWSAIDDGCTHVLTLCTKPKLDGLKTMTKIQSTLIRDFFMTPKFMPKRMYKVAEASTRGSRVTEKMLGIDCPQESAELFGAHVYTLFPEAQPVGSLCKKVNKLKLAKEQGHDAVTNLLKEVLTEPTTDILGHYE